MEFHEDPAFNAQYKRTVGYCVNDGAEISECLSTVRKISRGDYNAWHNVWKGLADRLNNEAEAELQHHHFISAGQKFLRASNYYRTAYFFLEENPEDKRIGECVKLSKETFNRALGFLLIQHIPLKIPFEGGFLPGYLYLSNHPQSKLLIDTGGGDGTLEETYFYSAIPAIRRGYHCLTFEGPGQGSVLRMQKKPFRYDWEVVVKAVIDHLEKAYPEIAKEIANKIAIRGDSFGGYLAGRAVANEMRIKACILNPGMLNPSRNLHKLSSDWLRNLLFFFSPNMKFKIKSRYMRFGAKSFEELLVRCKPFNLTDEVKKIRCSTLVIDNEEEHITKGEALKLYEQLECPKRYYLFKKDQCSGGHCQPLAQLTTEEVIFDWLDAIFPEKALSPEHLAVK